MRVLAYADLQATIGHERSFTQPTKSLQLWRMERFFDEVKRIYDQFECHALWDLGDTTDDRVAIPVPVLDLLCDRLEHFTGKWNIKLVGNHEQYLRDTTVNAGKAFRKHFQVVETVDVFEYGKFNILCASYHDDFQVITDFLRNAPQHRSILLGHFPVVGCQMSTGTSLTGVPRNMLSFVKLGLLGHVHLPQQIDDLHYIGSPFQQHWGEAGEHKRVAVLDISEQGIFKLGWQLIQGMPLYRQVNFEEWQRLVKPDSEDRYKVVLTSLEETEAFYAHPLANRVDEPIHDYAQTVKTQSTNGGSISNSKEDLMKRYMAENPPGERHIEMDDATMLAFGEEISQPSQ